MRSQHLSRQLLIAASDQEALAAREAEHDDGVCIDMRRKCARVRIAYHGAVIRQDVEAEQRGVHAETAFDCGQGAARPEHERAAMFCDALRDRLGDFGQHELLYFASARFHVLQEAADARHRQFAVVTCRYAPFAQRRLIDVAHLSCNGSHEIAIEQPRNQSGRVARRNGEDAGVHLHAGGYTDHRKRLRQRFRKVARGTVAAGEHQHVDAVLRQCRGRRVRIRCARRRRGGTNDLNVEAETGQRIGSHRRRPTS